MAAEVSRTKGYAPALSFSFRMAVAAARFISWRLSRDLSSSMSSDFIIRCSGVGKAFSSIVIRTIN